MPLKFIHVVCGKISFLYQALNSMYMPHFLYPFNHHGHLSCFYLLATIKSAAMNMGVQISLQDPTSIFFDIFPDLGLLDHMVMQ